MAQLFRGQGQQKSQKNEKLGETQVLPETTWTDATLPSGIPVEGNVVITISRQFGSGGAEIGRLVSDMTGLQYVDHEIIDEVARRLGVDVQQADRQDEHTAGTVRHILEAIQSSHLFTVNYTTLFSRARPPAQSKELAYFRLTQRVVLEMATEGNVVIVGRGSQFLLHSSPRTLHIYIFAPLPYRIENVMKHFQLDRTAATMLIEQRDYQHDAYLRRYYGSDGHQPGLYHLLINTSLFPHELAAHFIEQALPVVKEIGA